jgi:hypothetical protein
MKEETSRQAPISGHDNTGKAGALTLTSTTKTVRRAMAHTSNRYACVWYISNLQEQEANHSPVLAFNRWMRTQVMAAAERRQTREACDRLPLIVMTKRSNQER